MRIIYHVNLFFVNDYIVIHEPDQVSTLEHSFSKHKISALLQNSSRVPLCVDQAHVRFTSSIGEQVSSIDNSRIGFPVGLKYQQLI